MKKAIVSVINDLSTDQRVNRTCLTLTKLGFRVLLIGRKEKNSLPLQERKYLTKRMNLIFEKGVLFYAEYNIRLFLFLLFNKADLLISNDLDTLAPNYLVSRLKKIDLIYDTHEIFTEVPELQNHKIKKGIWKKLEQLIFPKLEHIITVNESIAEYYQNEYRKELNIVRNIPLYKKPTLIKTREELQLPSDKKIILLQGAGINIDRGAEELIEAMQYLENVVLLIIGGGDVIDQLKNTTTILKLNEKIYFIKKLPFEELMQYTILADIGITIDKDTNINYRYSLPNKLFDYIYAGIPILASPLKEIKKVIDQYDIGAFIDDHSPKHIADKIQSMLASEDKMKTWKENTIFAASQLKWEHEEKELIKIVQPFA